MSDEKTPFSEAYIKARQSFLSVIIFVFGAMGILAIVVAVVLSRRSGFEPYPLITIGMILSLLATAALYRKAALTENVAIFRAIQELRGGHKE